MTVRVWVGAYTDSSPSGLHLFDFGPDTTMVPVASSDGLVNPSFLTGHPDLGIVYAVTETAPHGGLSAVSISNGRLDVVDSVSSHGGSPCHVTTVADHVLVANYGSGGVAIYALRHDGTFGDLVAQHVPEGSGPHPRQDASHVHCVRASPDGRTVYAADLGTDRIMRYRLDGTGDGCSFGFAGETAMAPGSGPRHLALHPDRPVMFAVCELDSTLMVLDVDPESGELHPRKTVSTLPRDAVGDSLAAAVRVHPDGDRIYVSNRGHDSIATFAFDMSNDRLELLGHVASGGRTPRDLAIDPSGQWLLAANQDSDTVVVFDLDGGDRIPKEVGVAARVSQPTCIAFIEENE